MGTNTGELHTSMATSLWALCPSRPPREPTVDHAFHQAAKAHPLGLLQVTLQMGREYDCTGEFTATSSQITILLWDNNLYSMRIIFSIFLWGKISWLVETDGKPRKWWSLLREIETCQPQFFWIKSSTLEVDGQLKYRESRQLCDTEICPVTQPARNQEDASLLNLGSLPSGRANSTQRAQTNSYLG